MASVGIIGAGTMGAGIAQVAAAAGWTVLIKDLSAEVVGKTLAGVRAQFARLARKEKLSPDAAAAAGDRLQCAETAAEFADCELIVEAVVEDFDVKTALLRQAAAAAPRAILATNTSSLSVVKLGTAIGAPARTVGMHFFNPVPLLPLVECIAGGPGSEGAVARIAEIGREWGKTPVMCRDTPGFIVNRVARGYYLEPLRMVDEGVAGIDEIDATLTRLGGFRMGPFTLMDLIGIDVNYAVSRSVWEQMGRPARLTPHPLQKQLFDAGNFGRKTKRGAYSYASEPALPALLMDRKTFQFPDDLYKAVRLFCDGAVEHSGSATEQYVLARTLGAIINEAALALNDEVASEADIDTAMRLGTNYPRGPLEWARKIGTRTCRHLLETMNRHVTDDRFAPAAWWRT